MSRIEPEAGKQGTVWQQLEGRGDKDGKKGKGLVKGHVWMTHGHGQQGGDWPWERGVGWAEESKEWKIGTTVIEQTTIKYLIKRFF